MAKELPGHFLSTADNDILFFRNYRFNSDIRKFCSPASRRFKNMNLPVFVKPGPFPCAKFDKQLIKLWNIKSVIQF